MPDPIQALDAIHAACWQSLSDAAEQPGHGWRRLALATVSAEGDGSDQGAPGLADVRTVVLREADPSRQLLVFYTDARSVKVAQLRAQPRATLLAWCGQLGWQLRLRVSLAVDTGGLAVSTRWAGMKLRPAAQDYLSPLPPGSPMPGDGADSVPPEREHSPNRETRNHFAVVYATVEGFDWLELKAQGHRRAWFDASGAGRWRVP